MPATRSSISNRSIVALEAERREVIRAMANGVTDDLQARLNAIRGAIASCMDRLAAKRRENAA